MIQKTILKYLLNILLIGEKKGGGRNFYPYPMIWFPEGAPGNSQPPEIIQLKCVDHTLFPKRNATLISRFFTVTLDQGQWPQVMSTKGNAPGSNRQKTPSENVKRFSQDTQ